MAELADALDLGSSIARCAGSSPASPTNAKVNGTMTNNETKDTTAVAEDEIKPTSPETAESDKEGEEEFKFVEEPTFEIDYKGDCLYEIKVTIPPANEAKLSSDTFGKLQHEAELPGFRRGRAPRKLIERKFAKAVRGDVEGKLVQAAVAKLVKEKNLKPRGVPEVPDYEKNDKRNPEDPIAFTLKFEVDPRVELCKYRGIAVERPIYTIQEKDIETAVKNLQSRYSVFESAEGIEAQEGDQAIISFKGTMDGAEFPGGAAENYPYILGSKRFFPEFEEVLLGAKSGETRTCRVTFPDSYPAEHLRGHTAQFEITINELKRRQIPELNDDFAKQTGFENVAALRESLANQLRERTMAESNEIAESRAVKAIIDASRFEIPKSLIEHMSLQFYEDSVNNLRTRHVPAAKIEERDEELRTQAREEALNAIKSWTVLNEIAEAEGIEVTDEDFMAEAANLSKRSGVSMEAVAKYLGEEQHRNTYERRILHNKVIAAIMQHATITDKEVTQEEFDKADDRMGGESAGE